MAKLTDKPRIHVILVLLVSLGVVGAALVAGSPASAQGMGYTDPAGDMWTENAAADDPAYVLDPTMTNGDIRGGSIYHNRYAVVIRQRFTDLTGVGSIGFVTEAIIRTNEGRTRFIEVGWDKTSGTYAELSRPSADGKTRYAVRCNLTGQLRFDTNTMVVRIPRTCLSSPRWIKVEAGAAYTDVSSTKYFADIARSSGDPDSPLVWTRRLYRG
jgi:hypothetical protein